MQILRLENVRRILVLNRNRIGDCVLTTPLLRALKRRYPRASLVVSVPESNRELLQTNPHVDEIMPRPETEITGWAAKVRFGLEMRRQNYDLIISLQEKSKFYGWTTRYAALLKSGSPVTISLDHRRTRKYYEYTVPVRSDQHEVYKYLGIAQLLGCPRDPNPVLELEPPADARERVAKVLQMDGYDPDMRFIGINPGGSTPNKRWPEERFAAVADRLHRSTGLPIMILGGPDDRERAARIAELMQHSPVLIAGRATLGDTAALLERCQLLITGDTGPMHMAVAQAVPVVAMFGPTNPVKFGPFTTLRSILRHEVPCPECQAPCLHTITAEECAQAAENLYSAPPPSPRVTTDW